MTPSDAKTYVFEGLEVILTGRTAKRELKGSGRAASRIDTIHEITPANKEDGSWTKWVRMSDLYEVEE